MGVYAKVPVTKRPWAMEDIPTEGGHGKYTAYALVDAEGRAICDTINSGVQTEHVEYGEEEGGSYAWDEQGRVDMEFAGIAVNAHEALVAALRGLVNEHIKRGGAFDEPLGESEQTPEINAALAALALAGA